MHAEWSFIDNNNNNSNNQLYLQRVTHNSNHSQTSGPRIFEESILKSEETGVPGGNP